MLHFRGAEEPMMRWVALIVSVSAVVAAHGAEPPDLVRACGTEFVRDGRAYRFVGMNIRGLVHYGGGDGALPYTNLGHIDENLAGAAGMGCRVVRVFAANKNITHQEAVNRLGYALDRANAYGIKLIIALTDFCPTAFHPQGDDGYYTQNPWGWTVLNHDWFAGGYQNNYLPYVALAVTTHKDHPAVFCWQLGNEIADQTSAATHDAFVHAMAAHIKAIDPHHMVSIGMLSLAHIPGYSTQAGINLYSDANLDFITAHRYNDDLHPIDFNVRDAVGKPIVISEAGCQLGHSAVGGDRVGFMDGRIDYFVNTRGARGFMNWGYQAQGYDIGDGDSIFGIDRYAHSDYNAMVNMYAGYATTLNAYEPEIGPIQSPRGRNVALDHVAWQADSEYNATYAGERALDGLLTTKWNSTQASPTHWLAVDLGQEQIITGFRAHLAGAGGEWSLFNLAQYAIQTGPSLSGPWTTLVDVDNASQADAPESALETPLRARYVRLYATDCGQDDYARLYEFEVIGDPHPRGDVDLDDDIDLADAACVQRCFRGSGVVPAANVGACDCAAADIERGCDDPTEGDVDWHDVLTLVPCLHGPDNGVPLECH